MRKKNNNWPRKKVAGITIRVHTQRTFSIAASLNLEFPKKKYGFHDKIIQIEFILTVIYHHQLCLTLRAKDNNTFQSEVIFVFLGNKITIK